MTYRPVLIALAVVGLACAGDAAQVETEDDKTIYAIGVTMARQLERFALTEEELAVFQLGLTDAATGKELQADPTERRTEIQKLAQTRQAAKAAENKKAAAAYLEKAAAAEGAVKTDSGLIFSDITAGTGESPTAASRVKVHYKGTLTDGTEFDSSYKRTSPATFPLGGVIKCWTEGLQRMKVGGKAQLVCPSDIAYGDGGRPPTIPPGATLVFEVELLEILK
jgi:FKBP-type peptidyl-prolyl cis-trans isomerase FkpA